MSTAKSTVVQEEPDILPDLKNLLKKSVGQDVQIIDCKTTDLLPAGENYASKMYKVDLVIKKHKNSPQEKLQLVAKMIPNTEFVKKAIKASISFSREIFVFEKLAAAYRQLEEEKKLTGRENSNNLFPKFYGGQLTRDTQNPDVADDNAILLLENIKVLGYDTMDRKKGLDLEHAKWALSELARYHALGIAIRTHKPAFFEESRKYVTEFPFEMSNEEFRETVDHITQLILKDSRIGNYSQRLTENFKHQSWAAVVEVELVEPWVSINHGDFWVNNIMYRHGKDGHVNGVKFVDFQISRICSPMQDLPYFLFASCSPEVLENHLDDLIDLYYNRLIDVLKKTDCDTSRFTRASFDEQLKLIANKNLFFTIMALKFFTVEVKEDTDMSDIKGSIMLSSASNFYLDRSWNIVKKYVEKGWV